MKPARGPLPAALIISFLEATDVEDAVGNAISLGGDSDTLACTAGSVADAYYGLSPNIELEARTRLDDDLRKVTDRFKRRFIFRSKV
jgi:ADP-ribosylglycohydrolase